MIRAIALVLALSVLGKVAAEWLQVPIPGAALGMIVLVAAFALLGRADLGTAKLFDAVAPHFALLFVPAAAGVVANADLLLQAWLHIAVAILFGTAVTIAITGTVAERLLRSLEEFSTA